MKRVASKPKEEFGIRGMKNRKLTIGLDLWRSIKLLLRAR